MAAAIIHLEFDCLGGGVVVRGGGGAAVVPVLMWTSALDLTLYQRHHFRNKLCNNIKAVGGGGQAPRYQL